MWNGTACYNPTTTGTVVVTSNIGTSWTISPATPPSGAGTNVSHSIANTQSGVIVTLGSVPNISGYTTSISNSQGSGNSVTVFGGTAESFTITYTPTVSTPVVTMTASPTSGTIGVVNPTITWSATNNPTSCTASGDWSGNKNVSGGSEVMGVLGSARTYTYTLTCTNLAGSGSASATVVVSSGGVSCAAPATGAFTGCYYDGLSFNTLRVSRTDAYPLNFDWGTGTPDPLVAVDNFSARWSGNFTFVNSTYRFTTTADDGVRVYVDGVLTIDRWIDQGPTTYTADVAMSAGTHLIRMEYYERGGGAVAALSWAPLASTNANVTVISNLPSSWVINPGIPPTGAGTSQLHTISNAQSGVLTSISGIANILGYTYAVTNSEGGGSAMTVFGGSNYSFSITYTSIGPPPSTFDYTLSATPVSVSQGSSGQSTITKTLISGTTEPVTLTATGLPSGVSVSYANQGCSPTCSGFVNFIVGPSVTPGTYSVVVSGISNPSNIAKQTTVNLTITAPSTFTANFIPPTSGRVGENTVLTGLAPGGTPPCVFTWTGTEITLPFVGQVLNINYQTTGPKTLTLTVDCNGVTRSVTKTFNIGVNLIIKEF